MMATHQKHGIYKEVSHRRVVTHLESTETNRRIRRISALIQIERKTKQSITCLINCPFTTRYLTLIAPELKIIIR